MNNEWLQSLKAGDEVAVVSGYHTTVIDFHTIDRTTATQIIINGSRYSRKEGEERGTSWRYRRVLRQATPQLKQEVADEREIKLLRSKAMDATSRLKIPEDRATLEQLIQALKPFVS